MRAHTIWSAERPAEYTPRPAILLLLDLTSYSRSCVQNDNSIAMVNLCRDEITQTLKHKIDQVGARTPGPAATALAAS